MVFNENQRDWRQGKLLQRDEDHRIHTGCCRMERIPYFLNSLFAGFGKFNNKWWTDISRKWSINAKVDDTQKITWFKYFKRMEFSACFLPFRLGFPKTYRKGKVFDDLKKTHIPGLRTSQRTGSPNRPAVIGLGLDYRAIKARRGWSEQQLNPVCGALRQNWWRYQNCLNRSPSQGQIRTILHIFIVILCMTQGKRARNAVIISAVRISLRRTAEERTRINSNRMETTVFFFNFFLWRLELLGLAGPTSSSHAAFKNYCSKRFFRPNIFSMLFSILISVAAVIGATVDNLMPADSLSEDIFTSESSIPVAPEDEGFLSSSPSDFTLENSQNLGFDDFSYLPSNGQASSDLTDELFDSDSPNSALETSCNIGKRDQTGFCSVDSAPAPPIHLELPDLLQMENIIIKGDSYLAPITIGIEDNSPGKCISLVHTMNLCCMGPLGRQLDSYLPLVVYETVGQCRPGK